MFVASHLVLFCGFFLYKVNACQACMGKMTFNWTFHSSEKVTKFELS